MRTAKKGAFAGTLAALLIAGLLATNFVVAQTSQEQTQVTSLDTLVNAAVASQDYAQSLISLATSSGVNISAASALLASGTSSLAAAQATLDPGGNATAGTKDAHDAMANFTAAAASASVAIEAVMPTSDTVQADSDTVVALNQSLDSITSGINLACANNSVPSSLAGGFGQDCGTGKGCISSAQAALVSAEAVVKEVGTGPTGTLNGSFEVYIMQARSNLSCASGAMMSLSAFTYSSRAEAYIDGPLATQYAAANSTIKLQRTLVGWFGADATNFQSLTAAQSRTTSAVNASALEVSGAISVVPTAPLSAALTSQENALNTAASDLVSLTLTVESITVQDASITTLKSDLNTADTDLVGYQSAVATLNSLTGSFSSGTIGNFGSYVVSLNEDEVAVASSSSSFQASLSVLQGQIGTVLGLFPELTVLSSWQGTLGELATTTSSGQATVVSSESAAYSSSQALGSDIASLSTALQIVSEMPQVLTANVTAVTNGETGLLNSTALDSLSAASSALQTDGQLTTDYSSSSQSLLSSTLAGFASAYQGVNTQVAQLNAQSKTTSTAFSSASALMNSDLNARVIAVNAALAAVTDANSAFESLEVAQGASSLAEAFAYLSEASSQA